MTETDGSSSPTKFTRRTAAAIGSRDTYDRRFAAGEPPETLDKDFLRRWVTARCDPYRDPIPEIPSEIILETARIYIDAYETITGKTFEPPSPDIPILARIRANLAQYF